MGRRINKQEQMVLPDADDDRMIEGIIEELELPLEEAATGSKFNECQRMSMAEYMLNEILGDSSKIVELRDSMLRRGESCPYFKGDMKSIADDVADKLNLFEKQSGRDTDSPYPLLDFIMRGSHPCLTPKFWGQVFNFDVYAPWIPGKTKWLDNRLPDDQDKSDVFDFYEENGNFAYSVMTLGDPKCRHGYAPVSSYQRDDMEKAKVFHFISERQNLLLHNLPEIRKNDQAIVVLADSLTTAVANQKRFSSDRIQFTAWYGQAYNISWLDVTPLRGRKVYYMVGFPTDGGSGPYLTGFDIRHKMRQAGVGCKYIHEDEIIDDGVFINRARKEVFMMMD